MIPLRLVLVNQHPFDHVTWLRETPYLIVPAIDVLADLVNVVDAAKTAIAAVSLPLEPAPLMFHWFWDRFGLLDTVACSTIEN